MGVGSIPLHPSSQSFHNSPPRTHPEAGPGLGFVPSVRFDPVLRKGAFRVRSGTVPSGVSQLFWFHPRKGRGESATR
eukprot:scaffold738_cov340-Pavlova_lutheri.AAC.15